MDMNVAFFEHFRIEPKPGCPSFDEAAPRLRAFSHHLPELAGQDQSAVTGCASSLDKQDVAADRGPCEAGGDAGNARAHRDLALEARRPEDFRQVFRLDPNVLRGALGNLHSGTAQHRADLPLKLTHAGFARLVGDDSV